MISLVGYLKSLTHNYSTNNNQLNDNLIVVFTLDPK